MFGSFAGRGGVHNASCAALGTMAACVMLMCLAHTRYPFGQVVSHDPWLELYK